MKNVPAWLSPLWIVGAVVAVAWLVRIDEGLYGVTVRFSSSWDAAYALVLLIVLVLEVRRVVFRASRVVTRHLLRLHRADGGGKESMSLICDQTRRAEGKRHESCGRKVESPGGCGDFHPPGGA